MYRQTPQSDLATLTREADAAAARLWRRLGVPRADLDDLRQELLLDLITRLPAFDPARGTLGAYAGLVLRNKASRIAERIMRERQGWNGGLLSLVTDGDADAVGDEVGEPDDLPPWHQQLPSAEMLMASRTNLGRAIDALSPRDRALCAALCVFPVSTLVESGFGARATIYRRIAELRCALTAYGLVA